MSREGLQDTLDPADAWRPLSLRPPSPPWLSRRARAAVLSAVLLAHLGLAVWLPWLDRGSPAPPEVVLLLDFTQRDPLPAPPPEPEPMLAPDRTEPLPRPARPESRPRRRPVAPQALQVQELPPPARRPLDLYGADGRVKLPKDVLERMDEKFSDERKFDYQIPGMERAEKLLNRPPPIAYESTRFDEYWKPDQDLLTELLTKMVEKTTREIRVKVPGRSQSTMVCKVSLLAFGGGCGVLTPGADYVGPVDDPDTLSPAEDKECQAWWEQIVGATTQDAWRRTRKLYEAQCRKPLERAAAG